MTFSDLLTNTYNLLPDAIHKGRAGTGMRVLAFKVTNFKGTKTKKIFSTVKSQERPVSYTQILEFNGIEDPENAIPDLDKVLFKCRCSCHNFYFMWGYWDKQHNALTGPGQKPYKRLTTTRPEVNPQHLPGMCKHIIRLVISMKHEKLLIGGSI